nr:Chain A, Putative Adenylate Kinase [Pyrococcus abyssi GE5]4CVN_B Chain B, Putative Adenylate Kinase [Pyrococcus abyssi GE5]4CVN_C Chain C, Putative Adenylate Kinase [Pyrococcus abyssi GE5]4CVN_D Chain D, Putative Adenylate Kinase [Pyrococcus abyssi GE5]4CW7_A Chain A, PUTATIVE ADENYLATE KINASE [Pyrococcus abyssi GE5]4CW7_C Chain C, PUTATIVE ADENYLATE KINASE [Pyrococcus abyssi GE5]4CW7_E Chain E, PUTATIVE ADENYLATE KINASE [Pyrococcus abyssi GE5]4CW7_G Chain G, PUTATIVE ADENYLATE KINASE [Py
MKHHHHHHAMGMLIAITGTPGVGKTTIAKLLAEKLGYEYVNLRDFALEKGCGREVDGEVEVEIDELAYFVEKELKDRNVVLDGHLSHLMPVDLVVVLRAHPRIIGERLRERGYSKEKIGENVEAELVDAILIEAIDEHENVIEVDTTNKTPEEIVEEIIGLIKSGVKRRVGIVDWSEVYDEIIPYLRLGGE